MMGHVLNEASPLVRMVTLDGEGCNKLIMRSLCGVLTAEEEGMVRCLPFFRELRYKSLPFSVLPRVPMRTALHEGSVIFGCPAVLHAVKNAASQACSSAKLLYCGDHVVDIAGMLRNGLPIAVYNRRDPMSDRHTSLLFNPFFIPESLESRLILACLPARTGK